MIFYRFSIILLIVLLSCSDKKVTTNENKFVVSNLSDYVSDEYFILTELDSSQIKTFNIWSQFITINSKFSTLNKNKIDHKSIISSIKIDLEKISKTNVPSPFSRPEIIGRLRVFKTFVYKIDSYNLSEKNMGTYKSDLEGMFKAYNALISKMNEVVEEN
jgi:hypothetical protein